MSSSTPRLLLVVVAAALLAAGCDDDSPANLEPTDVAPDSAVDTTTLDNTHTADTTPPDTVVPTDADTSSAPDTTADADACEPECCACAWADPACCEPCDRCEPVCGDGCVGDDCTPVSVCSTSDRDGTLVCDSCLAQPASSVCLDPDGDGIATCWQACAEIRDCDTGSLCITELGYCQPSECTPSFFGGQDDCPPGSHCVEVANGASFCVEDGEPPPQCETHADCPSSQGLVCVDGECALPECTPLSNEITCPMGETCVREFVDGEPIDVGHCVALCDPLARDAAGQPVDTCGPPGDGRTCQIIEQRLPDGTLAGFCVDAPAGTAGAGAPCDNDTPATTCSQPDHGADPQLCVGATCKILCDPQDQTTCPIDGQSCFPVTLQFADGSTFDPDWGLCDTTCTTTWDPDDAGTECPGGEYCWPDFDIADLGRCFPADVTDTGRDGDACNVTTRDGCDNLHLCFTSETDMNGNPTAAECGLLCDPSAAAGEAGRCADDANGQPRTCLALTIDDGMGGTVDLPVGTCMP